MAKTWVAGLLPSISPGRRRNVRAGVEEVEVVAAGMAGVVVAVEEVEIVTDRH